MNVIETDLFDVGYVRTLLLLMQDGKKVSPRNINTVELSPFTLKLENPWTRLIQNTARNTNLGLNIVEFLAVIGGDNRTKLFEKISPSVIKFSDNSKTFRGGYGPRLRSKKNDQFIKVIEKLKSDKDSRQAIMTIFDPRIDYVETKDVPCTVMFHFMIRKNKLNMNVYMRSNDVILGHVIDVFVFTMIQEVIANELGIEMGEYNHIVGSLHLYETDFEKANKIIEESNIEIYEMPKMQYGLAHAENLYAKLFNKKRFQNDFSEVDYWNNLELAYKYQLLCKNKKYKKIDINNFTDEIYIRYFERKLWEQK
jgi:thymidylate synthase